MFCSREGKRSCYRGAVFSFSFLVEKAVASLSDEGLRVISAGLDNAILVFSVPSGEVLRRLHGHDDAITSHNHLVPSSRFPAVCVSFKTQFLSSFNSCTLISISPIRIPLRKPVKFLLFLPSQFSTFFKNPLSWFNFRCPLSTCFFAKG